jgi:small subunit ribosomal protein S18
MKQKKECYFKKNNIKYIDYKDLDLLRKFINPYGRLIGRKRSGVSAKKQRELSQAVKRARFMGLLPFVAKGE